MEIKNLIDRLDDWDGVDAIYNGGFVEVNHHGVFRLLEEAAAALEQLQAENDRLGAELEKEEAARKKQADILYELRGQKYESTTAIDQLRAENDRFRRERDEAVEEIPKVCYYCKHRKGWKTCNRFNGNSEAETCTNWQWRGLKEE